VAQLEQQIAASGESQKVVFVLVFGDGKIDMKQPAVLREKQQVISRGTP
jgi:hypothetical protein